MQLNAVFISFCVMIKFLLFQCAIKWIDEKNLVACLEAGIIGQDLERRVSDSRKNKNTPSSPTTIFHNFVKKRKGKTFLGNKISPTTVFHVCKQ